MKTRNLSRIAPPGGPHLGWSQRSTHPECHRKWVGIIVIKLISWGGLQIVPERLVEVSWIFLVQNYPHLGWSQRSTHAECHRKWVGIMIIKLDLLRRPTNYAWKFGWDILNISCKKTVTLETQKKHQQHTNATENNTYGKTEFSGR